MFKKIVVYGLLGIFVGVLVFGAVNRTQARSESGGIAENRYGRPGNPGSVQPAGSAQASQTVGGNGQGRGISQGAAAASSPAFIVGGALSQDEEDALLYMREEEKLAHDVYVSLYAKWGLPIFDNISRSEATHTAAVKTLLDRYSLSDPASSQVGVFTNPDLKAMYTDLIAKGSISLAEAMKVGAIIEEVDIQIYRAAGADRQRRHPAGVLLTCWQVLRTTCGIYPNVANPNRGNLRTPVPESRNLCQHLNAASGVAVDEAGGEEAGVQLGPPALDLYSTHPSSRYLLPDICLQSRLLHDYLK
jgi:hypothetical protein